MVVEDVEFDSHGTVCRGWLYLPESKGPHPVVVLSHGYGFQHAAHYWRTAQSLADLGIAVLDYDPRCLGASDGVPRHLVDMKRQVEDLRSAVAYVRTRPEVDAGRVVLYGSSAGGGVAIDVAAQDPGIAAALLMVPHVDGLTNLPGLSVSARMKLASLALRDRLGRARGREPMTMRIVGAAGEAGALIDRDGAILALREEMMPGGTWSVADETYTGPGIVFENLCTPWEVLAFVTYRPGRRLTDITCPIMAVLATNDTVTPTGPQRRALRAAGAQITEVPGGHFAPFLASQQFDRALGYIAGFLREHGFVPDPELA